MPSRADDSFLQSYETMPYFYGPRCQCPLGLMTHFYARSGSPERMTMSLCQCPLGLMTHFYVPLQKPRFYAVSRACFCRYLSEYSDKSSFSCMFTIWTYLTHQIFPNPEFTIAQNYSSVILFFYFYSL